MASPKHRIMYVEQGGGLGSRGGRIGRVMYSKTGKTLYYRGATFASLAGRGYKTNHFDCETLEPYWISGPRKDGNDPLYPGVVEIDEDVREEYWRDVRGLPRPVRVESFRAPGKYSKRRPHPELNLHGPSRGARR